MSTELVEQELVESYGQDARFWRLEEPIKDERGFVKVGGMWPEQRAWWHLPNFVRLFVGGYGAGKTSVLCKRSISLALENAPAPVMIVSPTYSMASETVIETLREMLIGKQTLLQQEGFRWTEKKSSPYRFEFTYRGRKGKILVYSGEDPKKLKGPNVAAAGIDEPFIQEEEVFTQVLARTRHPRAVRSEINLTGTPEQLNWGFELAEGELNEQHDVGLIRASTKSNLALDTAYFDRLESALSDEAAQAYVEGHFVNLSTGLVYSSFSKMENVVWMAVPPGAELGAGMDFNVDPMSATVFWNDPRAEHFHIFHEVELANSDTEDMCAYLKENFWEMGLRDVYPDPFGGRSTTATGGKTDYDIIRRAGFTIHKRNDGGPRQRDRYNAANGKFRARDGRVTGTIDPGCKLLQRYLMSYTHEKKHLRSHKAMSHLLDAATYPMEYLYPVDKRSLTFTTKLHRPMR